MQKMGIYLCVYLCMRVCACAIRFVCWMGRWRCLSVSSPFHKDPLCCCWILQPRKWHVEYHDDGFFLQEQQSMAALHILSLFTVCHSSGTNGIIIIWENLRKMFCVCFCNHGQGLSQLAPGYRDVSALHTSYIRAKATDCQTEMSLGRLGHDVWSLFWCLF